MEKRRSPVLVRIAVTKICCSIESSKIAMMVYVTSNSGTNRVLMPKLSGGLLLSNVYLQEREKTESIIILHNRTRHETVRV